MRSGYGKYLIFCLWLCFSCTQTEQLEEGSPTLFRQVTDSGITFQNNLNYTEEWNFIQYLYFYNGAGVAAGDIDNDGLIDLFFTSNQGSNRLYRNLGDLKFEDISESAGVVSENWSTGVTMADINHDGWLDIYVCQVGEYKNQEGRNQLFINNQDGTFTESAESFGLNFSGLSTQAAFFDYDADGDLDMYLLNHSVHSVESYGPAGNRGIRDERSGDRLYKNLHTEGEARFEDVTLSSGIYSSRLGYGLGVVVFDYDRDGWADLYIANDFHENDYLYRNNGDGTFEEKGLQAFGHTSRYSMGVDAADLNNDGYPEVISLDMLPSDGSILRKSAAEDRNEVSAIKAYYGYGPQQVRNAVQYNWGNGRFSDIAPFMGIHATDWSWSPLIADFDNDGRNDIYISNGIARRPNDLDYIQYLANNAEGISDEKLISQMPELKISNVMYSNGDDVTTEWGLETPSFSNGAVYADLDRDGDLDIVVSNIDQPVFLFENQSDSLRTGKSLTLQFDAMSGAQVTAYSGENQWYGYVNTTRGFLSSVPPELHIGLGEVSEVDSVEIIWPDRSRQMLNVLSHGIHRVIKANTSHYKSESKEDEVIMPLPELGKVVQNSDFRDYQREHLIPENLSMEGPAVASGDINGDGLTDLFVGGAHGEVPSVYIQQEGGFVPKRDVLWLEEAKFEDVDAALFDADGDGDLDLYVVSGGNQYPEGHFLLRDRLYMNDGSGVFSRARLPEVTTNGSVVRPADIDADGDLDLFVGSRSVPGAYGMSPRSYMLINDGATFSINTSFHLKGMVTDAVWDSVGAEFIVVGDWMPITRVNSAGWSVTEIDDSRGLWKAVQLFDVDGDGEREIIAGNLGLNTPLSSGNVEVMMLLNDFDENGQTDPVIFLEKQGKMIPFASKDDLAKQMPVINKSYVSYTDYSNAQDLPGYFRNLNPENLQELYIDTFAHVIVDADNSLEVIPGKIQWTQIDEIACQNAQLVFGGNSYRPNIALGKIDAVPLLIGNVTNGDLSYEALTPFQGDVRKVISIDIPGSEIAWIVFLYDDSPVALKQAIE